MRIKISINHHLLQFKFLENDFNIILLANNKVFSSRIIICITDYVLNLGRKENPDYCTESTHFIHTRFTFLYKRQIASTANELSNIGKIN